MPREERAEWLEKLAAALKPRVPQVAEAISHEVGTALGYSTKVQVEFPIMMIGMNARFIRNATLEETLGHSLVVKEPVGVVGCITPWNYPLHQISAKVAYAMAAGCTVVLKPSEIAPVDAFVLAEIIDEVGLPAGVFNLVSGVGPVVGEAIALTKALEAETDVAAGLARYQAERKPIVQKLVTAARTSADWYERFPEHMTLDLMDFAYS